MIPCSLARRALFAMLLVALGSTNSIAGQAFVADYLGNKIDRFDAISGNYLGSVLDVPRPHRLEVRDGTIYVSHLLSTSPPFNSKITRYDYHSEEFDAAFGINASYPLLGFALSPNGSVYATSPGSFPTGFLGEYDGHTGTLVGEIATGIDRPVAVAIGLSGDIFVARGYDDLVSQTSSVDRFDGQTGQFKGVFTASGTHLPQDLVFDTDGNLYVSNQNSDRDITKYDGTTGQRIWSFDSGHLPDNNPQQMTFLPNGDLLVASGGTSVRRYNAATGQYLGEFSTGGVFYTGIAYVPEPSGLLLAAAAGILILAIARRRRIRDRRTSATCD